MTKQTIGIGSTANDGTGDPLRTAFDKCNDNFDDLYGNPGGEIIVAGADAPAKVKVQAHYVCDGTADEVQINSAVADLGTRGGRIRLIGGFTAQGIQIKEKIHFVGDNFGSSISLTSGASQSLFVFAGNGAAVFTGGGIHGLWLEGGNQTGRHAIDFTGLNQSLVEFDVSYCFINNFDIGIRFGPAGDRLPRVANTRIWNCEQGIYCGEHPQISDSELRYCKLGLTGFINDAFIADTKIADCGVGISQTTSVAGETATTLANTQIIASGSNFSSTAVINGYAYFPASGNFYKITARPSTTELTVTGDPSGEGTKFWVISSGITTTICNGLFFFGNKIDCVVGNGSQVSNCFHGVRTDQDGKIGVMVRGNGVQIQSAKVNYLSPSYGYSDGLIMLHMTGSSTTMQAPVINGCNLTNKAGYKILNFAAGRLVDGLMVTTCQVTCPANTPLIGADAVLRGAIFSGNSFFVSGNVGGPLVVIADGGSTNSSLFSNNVAWLSGGTMTGMVGGDWERGLIANNLVSGGSAAVPIVAPGTTTTSAVNANNNAQ